MLRLFRKSLARMLPNDLLTFMPRVCKSDVSTLLISCHPPRLGNYASKKNILTDEIEYFGTSKCHLKNLNNLVKFTRGVN